ncbi:MAG: NAD(P)H-dependent glycerol-3-phosphate dehydrogenase [Candidatus Babeliaceae bacterium]|jgi:glycerol-3-phosphate dehydrogenase (NAD(P)+)
MRVSKEILERNVIHTSVAVLGAGAWGKALALLLADNGHLVTLWDYQAKSLPIGFPTTIILTNTIQDILEHRFIFVAIPVPFLRSVISTLISSHHNQVWVMGNKGIEQTTLLLPTQIINDILPQAATAVISGPSFAKELTEKKLTHIVIAGARSHEISNLLSNSYCMTHQSQDLIGIQLSAALKNPLSLGMGLLAASGYGLNAQAAYITQALSEIVFLVKFLGGKQETVYGLAGLGDLFLTCNPMSKNYQVGMLLGSGKSLQEAISQFDAPPEGLSTLASVQQIITSNKLDLPLLNSLYQVVYEQHPVNTITTALR